jgi:hypothetical protein
MQNNTSPKLAWFNDAKFGVFIRWAIYAVGQYPESWSFYNHGSAGNDPGDTLSNADYMASAGSWSRIPHHSPFRASLIL